MEDPVSPGKEPTKASRELLAIQTVSKTVNDLAKAGGSNNDKIDFIKRQVLAFLPAIPTHLSSVTAYNQIILLSKKLEEGSIQTIVIVNPKFAVSKGGIFWILSDHRDPEALIKCKLLDQFVFPPVQEFRLQGRIMYEGNPLRALHHTMIRAPVEVRVNIQQVIFASQFPKYFQLLPDLVANTAILSAARNIATNSWRRWLRNDLLVNGEWTFKNGYLEDELRSRSRKLYYVPSPGGATFRFIKIFENDTHNTIIGDADVTDGMRLDPVLVALDRETTYQNWYCYSVEESCSNEYRPQIFWAVVSPEDAALLGLKYFIDEEEINNDGDGGGGDNDNNDQGGEDDQDDDENDDNYEEEDDDDSVLANWVERTYTIRP